MPNDPLIEVILKGKQMELSTLKIELQRSKKRGQGTNARSRNMHAHAQFEHWCVGYYETCVVKIQTIKRELLNSK